MIRITLTSLCVACCLGNPSSKDLRARPPNVSVHPPMPASPCDSCAPCAWQGLFSMVTTPAIADTLIFEGYHFNDSKVTEISSGRHVAVAGGKRKLIRPKEVDACRIERGWKLAVLECTDLDMSTSRCVREGFSKSLQLVAGFWKIVHDLRVWGFGSFRLICVLLSFRWFFFMGFDLSVGWTSESIGSLHCIFANHSYHTNPLNV